MKSLVCIKCGKSRETGRRVCASCHKEIARERQKQRAAVNGRYMYDLLCVCCSSSFKGWRNTQRWCGACYDRRAVLIKNKPKASNHYVFTQTPGRTQHRDVAEQILGRALNSSETVHHMDHDPKNNHITNLVVLTRSTHGKLHKYLDDQRALLEKSGVVNSENCWNTLIAPMTTAWLETTSAKVKKLWEIGQSAGERRTGEASETRHGTPDH